MAGRRPRSRIAPRGGQPDPYRRPGTAARRAEVATLASSGGALSWRRGRVATAARRRSLYRICIRPAGWSSALGDYYLETMATFARAGEGPSDALPQRAALGRV